MSNRTPMAPRPATVLPDGRIEFPLTKGYTTVIDPEDADLALHRWYAVIQHNRAYARRLVKRKTITLHIVIMERILGRALIKGELVDHVDNNSTNNRRENLRLADYIQNSQNRKNRSDNTSGYKGVYFHKVMGKWRAQISVNKKQTTLGFFETPEEAYAAYCEAAGKYHGEFKRLE